LGRAPGDLLRRALVWPDAGGLARWLADPRQQPFFDAVRLDQIRAQNSC